MGTATSQFPLPLRRQPDVLGRPQDGCPRRCPSGHPVCLLGQVDQPAVHFVEKIGQLGHDSPSVCSSALFSYVEQEIACKTLLRLGRVALIGAPPGAPAGLRELPPRQVGRVVGALLADARLLSVLPAEEIAKLFSYDYHARHTDEKS